MKSLIGTALIVATVLISQANADMMMPPEDIQMVREALRGKQIVQPQAMMEGWLQHKAKTLSLASRSMEDFASQFKKNKCIYREWIVTAKKMKHLAKRFEGLSLPSGKLIKNMAHVDDWMMLKAEKLALKSEQMKIIADQMTDPKVKELLLQKAQEVAEVGRTIKEAVSGMQEPSQEPQEVKYVIEEQSQMP